MEPFQASLFKKHSPRKKKMIGLGGQKNTPPYTFRVSYARSKSAPPTTMGEQEEELPQTLSSALWTEDGAILPHVRERLLRIVEAFVEFLGVAVEPEDVVITGSMAQFSWTSHSDVDLHVILNYSEIDSNQDLVKEFLKSKRVLWNTQHSLTLGGHPIELYVQSADEPHISGGVYSVLSGEWLIKPEYTSVSVDSRLISCKVECIVDMIEAIEKLSAEDAYLIASSLRNRLARFRKAGLEKNGEYSYENLIFKALRNAGYLDRLSDLKNAAFNAMLV